NGKLLDRRFRPAKIVRAVRCFTAGNRRRNYPGNFIAGKSLYDIPDKQELSNHSDDEQEVIGEVCNLQRPKCTRNPRQYEHRTARALPACQTIVEFAGGESAHQIMLKVEEHKDTECNAEIPHQIPRVREESRLRTMMAGHVNGRTPAA